MRPDVTFDRRHPDCHTRDIKVLWQKVGAHAERLEQDSSYERSGWYDVSSSGI